MLPIGRKVAGVVSPLARALMDMPLPDSEVFASIEELYSELDKIRTLLTDAEITSVRLAGLEPTTSASAGLRSILLSYKRLSNDSAEGEI